MKTVLGLFNTLSEGIPEGLSFSGLFTMVGDSLLTTVLVCFLAHWVFNICVDLGKGSGRR